MDHVAHNSFIHCYTELGMFGGTLFLTRSTSRSGRSCVWVARLCRRSRPELERLRPYLMAIVAGYAAGLMSLSCAYTIPTYTVLGLSAVFIGLAEADLGVPVARCNGPLVRRLVALSASFIVLTYVGVFLLKRT